MSLKTITIWLVTFVLVLLFFYGLNHSIMGMQGLPLNWDLTPAQWTPEQ